MRHSRNRNHLLLIVSLAAVVCGVTRPVHGQDPFFVVTDIGAVPGGAGSKAYAVNNYGQVVGHTPFTDAKPACWHWQNGTLVDLNATIHFRNQFTMERGEAYDVSDADQIVGGGWYELKVAWREAPLHVLQAFVTRPAVLSDFGTPLPGDAVSVLGALGASPELNSCAVAVSNANHVVGWANISDGTQVGGIDVYQYHNNYHAFLVRPGGDGWYRQGPVTLANGAVVQANQHMVDLGVLQATDQISAATDVNDAGWIVGYSFGPGVGYTGFLIVPEGETWADLDATFVNRLMQPLGTLGGMNSWARAVNNAGVIVGDADTAAYDTRAFRWQAGQMTELGTLGGDNSAAMDISDQGVIVGWAENANREKRAVMWVDGRIIDLNDRIILTKRWRLTEARAINERGQIVGWGELRDDSGAGAARAFLLDIATAEDLAKLDPDSTPTGTVQPGGQNGGTGTIAPPLDLNPIAAGDQDADEDGGNATPLPPVIPACGFGLAGFLPLTAAGLVGLKLRRCR